MAVVLRLKRTGRRNRPAYRISVTDSRNPRDGRTLETLGHYDPASPVADLQLRVDVERARHWIEHGAVPSETVASILRGQGVVMPVPKKRTRPGRKKKTATKARRATVKKARAEAKGQRRDARLSAKRAAAKAAAAPAEGAE
jgi:small subunit ribosomal protein S16